MRRSKLVTTSSREEIGETTRVGMTEAGRPGIPVANSAVVDLRYGATCLRLSVFAKFRYHKHNIHIELYIATRHSRAHRQHQLITAASH